MPLQIIQGRKIPGTDIGEGLGRGLGAGLSAYAETKLGQMNRQQRVQELEAAGLPREYAMLIEPYEPKYQQEAIQNYFDRLGNYQQSPERIQQQDMLAQLQGQQKVSPYAPGFPMEKRQAGYRGEQQAPDIARLQEELGRKPNLAQVLSAPPAAKPGQVGKLTPAQDRWVKHAENQAIIIEDMKPIVDDIKEIISRGNYDTGFVSALTGDTDPSLLSGDTQLLYHRFNALLSKQMAAETTGRGSDLLRGVIKAGKLNLGLEPENIKTLINNLEREFKRKDLESSLTADYISSGKPPLDLGQRVRQDAAKQLQADKSKKALTSAELAKLPKEVLQLKDGQEAIGDDGKVIAYREDGKFYKG